MDFDYTIEQDKIFLTEGDNKKDKAKKKRRALGQIEENLLKIARDKISGKLGNA